MSYPFTLQEVKLLLNFLDTNPTDAVKLSGYCLKLLEKDETTCKIELGLTIPFFSKEEINISKQQLIINRRDIRDFFIVYKVIDELHGLDSGLNRLWEINHKSKNKGKVKNDEQHLLILYSKYYKEDITFAFEKDSEIFWQTYNGFVDTINLLELPANTMLVCLSSIYHITKNDWAFNKLINRLIECAKESPKYYKIVFDEIIKSKVQEKLIYAGALAEGLANIYGDEKYNKVGKELIIKATIEHIWSGLDILGRLNYSKKQEVEEAIFLAFNFTSHSEGNIRFKATSTLLMLAGQTTKAHDYINQLSVETDDNIINPLVNFIWRNWENRFKENWFQNIIGNIFQNQIHHQNTIRLLTYFLIELYEKGKKEFCFKLIEKWLKCGQEIKSIISCFQRFAEIDFNFLISKYTNWLASGNLKILRSTLEISSLNYEKDLQLDISVLNKFNVDKIKQLVAAIIGFVYMKKPLTQSLLSVLDSKHIDLLGKEIKGVLVGYVCYTYPKVIDEFIKPELKSSKGKKKAILKEIIKEVDEYFGQLEGLKVLKEFSGSDIRRENYHKAFDKVQQGVYKKFDDQNAFLQSVKNIKLRTGPVWFCKVDGEYQRENKMGKISSSFELPRAEYIDPANFENYRIRMRLLAIEK